jgi:hypothetical protein
MPAADPLPRLVTKFGSRDNALKVALARPGLGDKLRALFVEDVSGFNASAASEVFVPPEHEKYVLERVADELLGGPPDGAGTSRLPRRDPLPVPLVEKVLQLRVDEGMAWKVIAKELQGDLSYRKVDYVRVAVKHGDLGWNRGQISFGPTTENTTAGIVLPER